MLTTLLEEVGLGGMNDEKMEKQGVQHASIHDVRRRKNHFYKFDSTVHIVLRLSAPN